MFCIYRMDLWQKLPFERLATVVFNGIFVPSTVASSWNRVRQLQILNENHHFLAFIDGLSFLIGIAYVQIILYLYAKRGQYIGINCIIINDRRVIYFVITPCSVVSNVDFLINNLNIYEVKYLCQPYDITNVCGINLV